MKNLFKNESGLAALEFALVVPFLLILFMGSIEVSRYILIQEKVENSAYAIADLTSQYMPATTPYTTTEIGESQIRNVILPQFARIMDPYSQSQDLMAIISSVTKSNGKLIINWQMSGGGTLISPTTYSVVTNHTPVTQTTFAGQQASFTGDYETNMINMVEGENTLVIEVFYLYDPILKPELNDMHMHLFNEQTLVSRVFCHPRNGALTTLPTN